MPQIQPMYFHRHRDTLIQQTSEARRRHVTNAFNTYVVCQKSSCFNRKMNISAFAKVFYKQIYKKFY